MPRWPEVRAIEWDRLDGAYAETPDVATALETLRFGDTSDDDAFADASSVLYGHLWHQGTIYPVTAAALPFVMDIVDLSPALAEDARAREEIAMFVPLAAAAARRATPPLGVQVMTTLAACGDRLRAWMKEPFSDVAVVAMLSVPDLRQEVLGGALVPRAEAIRAICSHALLVDEAARAWASQALSEWQHPVIERARALLLQSHLDETAQDRLGAASDAVMSADWARLDALAERFGIRVAAPLDVSGPTHARITMAMPDWFVAAWPPSRQATIRWKAHPFAEGDDVVVMDVNERNIPRVVRGTGDKAHHQARFGETGSMLPSE